MKLFKIFTEDDILCYPQLKDIIILWIGSSFMPIDNQNQLDLLVKDRISDIIWGCDIAEKESKLTQMTEYMSKYFSLVSQKSFRIT